MGAQTPDSGSSTARAELFVLSGPDVGRSFEIVHGSTLGRAPDRGVVLRDRSISRHHAHFECVAGSWSIVDDGSTNGFVVDGARRQRAELTDLREFVIGELLVRMRTQVEDAPRATGATGSNAAPPSPSAPAGAGTPSPKVPAPPPAEAIEIEDEILLDSAPEATRPALAANPPRYESAPTIASASPPRAATRPPAMSSGEPDLAARGRRVLQYHKQDARAGLLVTDLGQRPLWLRAIVYALVLAFAGALAWGAYRGVLSLRENGAASSE